MPSPANSSPEPLLRDRNLYIVFGITLMAVMGVSSVTPVFPDVAERFGKTPERVGLLVTMFTLPGVFLAPVLGVLSDRYGRKRILVPSLLLYGVAGTACAFARDFTLLLQLRFLQGVGGAALGALNLTIIGDLYEGRRRTAAMGYVMGVLNVGTASYPVIGGLLATIAWYVPFMLPALATLVAMLVLFGLRNPEPEREGSLKQYLKRTFSLLKDTKLIVVFVTSMVTFIILFGSYLTYYPFLARHEYGHSSLMVGALMSVTSFAAAITSFNLGRLTRILPERRLVVVGFGTYTVGLLLVASVPAMPLLVVSVIILGMSQSLIIPNALSILTAMAPLKQRAAIVSLNGMILRGGQTLGPVVMGAAFSMGDVSTPFLVGAVLSVLMGALFFARMR